MGMSSQEEELVPQGKDFDPEFREACVRLLRAGGRSQKDIAEDLGVSARQLRRWLAQADIEEGKKPGIKRVDQLEVARLRRENAALREEIEIHKKLQSFLAQETRRTDTGSSRGKRSTTR
jgi:transposase-like protein